MRFSTASTLAFAGQALAFPAAMWETLDTTPEKLQGKLLERRQGVPDPDPIFDAAKQYISTSGQYAFKAPKKTDLRGPCPGLNALANHGYLPHNGVATIGQFIDATNTVFGMGVDLASFLSVYGAVMDGDLLSWSIGGPPPSSLVSPLAGLIGQPEGISGSHNKYESDASPGRGDLYEYGNDYKLVLKQFKQLYNMQANETEETSNYDLNVLTKFRASRFQQSIENNPYFFNGPFTGIAVQPAAYTFIFRFMANHSSEYPAGRLSQNVLKSFFSVTGDKPSQFKYKPGYERIPDNWYRRAIGDEYTIPYFQLDLTDAALAYPQFLDVGGNLGKTNSFTGVDITNLTGGVYNTKTLLEGNNLLCFAFEAAAQMSPDILINIFLLPSTAQGILNEAFGNATSGLGCPQLNNIQQGQFEKYPGYSYLNPNGTYNAGETNGN